MSSTKSVTLTEIKRNSRLMDYKRLNEVVRAFMKENGFSEVAYCEFIKVSRNTFRDAMKGKRNTTIETLEKILSPTPYDIGIFQRTK